MKTSITKTTLLSVLLGAVCGAGTYEVAKHVDYRISFSDISEKMNITDERINGIAWFDYDNDGDLDLLTSRLYRNDDYVLTDVTSEAGFSNIGFGNGIAAADYDNDGCLDVYIAQPTGNDILMRNNCNGEFSDVTAVAGIENYGEASGVAWADYNNDGWIDVYVANISSYVEEGEMVGSFYPNKLFKNNGDGTFVEVTESARVEGLTTCRPEGLLPVFKRLFDADFKTAFQPVWLDYNGDSFMDLFIASDVLVSPLYKNNGDGTFTDVTTEAGVCKLGTGMGVTAQDFDYDGDTDIYVTNVGPNYLWENDEGFFTERALEYGVGEIGVGWGAVFFDMDNDRDLDLYVANGRLMGPEHHPKVNVKKNDLDVLFENHNGLFVPVEARRLQLPDQETTSVSVADYNNDGAIDMFVAHFIDEGAGANHQLWENSGNKNNWITVALEGTKSNKAAIGARITVVSGEKQYTQTVTSGSSFLSQNSLWKTFGLGKGAVEKIEIIWPSGTRQVVESPEINTTVFITEEG